MSTSVIAEIQSIQGTAYAVAVDGSKRTLQLGDQLFEGEVLETSEGGAVQLLLTDGSSYEVAGIPQLLLSAELLAVCLLYTSPSPRDISGSRMPSSA